jgi:hypothetical protein
MVAFTPNTQRSAAILPNLVGVFEDDAALLLMAARYRSMEFSCPRDSGPIDADDLSFENARRVDAESWDF